MVTAIEPDPIPQDESKSPAHDVAGLLTRLVYEAIHGRQHDSHGEAIGVDEIQRFGHGNEHLLVARKFCHECGNQVKQHSAPKCNSTSDPPNRQPGLPP